MDLLLNRNIIPNRHRKGSRGGDRIVLPEPHRSYFVTSGRLISTFSVTLHEKMMNVLSTRPYSSIKQVSRSDLAMVYMA